MCRKVTCEKCHKATYAGCGMHVEQVLGGVSKSDRCACREAQQAAPPAGAPATGPEGAPWWKVW